MAPHILTATVQSTLITLCSCIFATFLTGSTPPVVPLLIFTVLSTPPNYLWQQYLERVFPGYTTQKLEVDDGGKSVMGRRLSKRNTMKKLVLDQTLGAVVNVVAFLGGVRLLRGVSLEESLRVVQEVSLPLQSSWPPVFLLLSFRC